MALKEVNSKDYTTKYYSLVNDKLVPNTNTSCWAGIRIYNFRQESIDIYIEDYEYEETIKYIPLLIKTINKITPCEIVTIDDRSYIKFRLLNTYDKSLLLLNWIRLLWYSPYCSLYKKDATTSINFFESLKKRRDRDYFVRLIKANIDCQKDILEVYSNGHSNVVINSDIRKKLKIKTSEDFNNFTDDSCFAIRTFLTT